MAAEKVRCQKAVADMKQKLEAECALRKKLEKEVKAISLDATGKDEVSSGSECQRISSCFRGLQLI
jgi:hypothetical protein